MIPKRSSPRTSSRQLRTAPLQLSHNDPFNSSRVHALAPRLCRNLYPTGLTRPRPAGGAEVPTANRWLRRKSPRNPQFNSQPWFVWISLFRRICLKALDLENSTTPSFNIQPDASQGGPQDQSQRETLLYCGTKGPVNTCFVPTSHPQKKKKGSVTQIVQLVPSGFPFVPQPTCVQWNDA